MEVDITTFISLLAAPLAACGAAYGGVKVGMNGLHKQIDSIMRVVSRLDERVDVHGEAIVKLEVETAYLKDR